MENCVQPGAEANTKRTRSMKARYSLSPTDRCSKWRNRLAWVRSTLVDPRRIPDKQERFFFSKLSNEQEASKPPD